MLAQRPQINRFIKLMDTLPACPAVQQMARQQQDEQLGSLEGVIGNLNYAAEGIKVELDEQAMYVGLWHGWHDGWLGKSFVCCMVRAFRAIAISSSLHECVYS